MTITVFILRFPLICPFFRRRYVCAVRISDALPSSEFLDVYLSGPGISKVETIFVIIIVAWGRYPPCCY